MPELHAVVLRLWEIVPKLTCAQRDGGGNVWRRPPGAWVNKYRKGMRYPVAGQDGI
jgi:hypothetical protein